MSKYFPPWNRETEKRHRAAWPALIFPRFKGLEEAGLSTPSHCTLPSWVSSSPWESPGRNSSNLPAEGTPCLLTPHSSLFPGCQGGSPLARTDAAGLPGRRRELLTNGSVGSPPSSQSLRFRDAFGLGCQAWVLSLEALV